MLSRHFPNPRSKGLAPSLAPVYSARDLSDDIPRFELPEDPSEPRVIAQLIKDELNLDGNAALNLASFVTTWMEPEAEELMNLTLRKNFVDAEEYPQTAALAERCVNIIANLFHAPESEDTSATGTATVGSSEAIHLAGLAMKWRWKKQRGDGARDVTPNLVMGANVQVCWEKFARYFDVEPRYVPMSTDRYVLGVDEALSMVDENTIGVVGILGSTYTGEYEPIAELAAALDQLESVQGLDVPIHVDAASGGFVAPFVRPDLIWDFRLPRVQSINTSGHKYGLVYPGIGWALWRDASFLPEELIFRVSYLGGDHPTFNLNFSRGSSQIIAQYYNLLRLGRSGYTRIMRSLTSTAQWLSHELESTGRFGVLSNPNDLPVVCVRLTDNPSWTVYDLSATLRERGWIVPAYPLAPNAKEIDVLRIVVREGLGRDIAQTLVSDIRAAMAHLDGGHSPVPHTVTPAADPTIASSTHPDRHHRARGVC
ncbi:MAG: glutamate decarboxylase [Acidimicrobiales bacterium]